MRRSTHLVWCIYGLFFVEGILFTAAGPLLPTLKAELDLSTSQTGLLAAGYVAGCVFGSPPAALASTRLGGKNCAVIGVALLGGGTLAFAVCGTFSALLVSQLVAGLGSAGIWIGAGSWLLRISADDERGRVLGVLFGVGALGEIMGPVVGALAANLGRAVTFTSIAASALVLCAFVTPVIGPARSATSLGVRAAAASKDVRIALALTFVPTVVWGALLVLGALELARLGASATAIGATFLVAAGIGAIQGPLVGRWSDRDGRLPPIRLGLLMCIPALVALAWAESGLSVALLLVVAFVGIRVTVVPVVALLVDACNDAGGGDILSLAAMFPVAAGGLAIGSAVSGALAEAVGSSATYYAFAAGVAVALWCSRSLVPAEAVVELGQNVR